MTRVVGRCAHAVLPSPDGINVNSANVVCQGNFIANYGTALTPNGHLNDSIIANNLGHV